MKNVIKTRIAPLLGIIALVAVIGLTVAACDISLSGGGGDGGGGDGGGGGGDLRDVLIGVWVKDGGTRQEKFDVDKSNTRYAAYFRAGPAGAAQYVFDIATYNGTTVTSDSHSVDNMNFTATIGSDGKLTVSEVNDVTGIDVNGNNVTIVFNGTYTKQ